MTADPQQPGGSASENPRLPPPPRRKPFVQQSFGDMLRSMIVLALLIAAVYACAQLLETDTEPTVRTVNYTSELAAARQLADYDVLAPTGLADGWRATSADVSRSAGIVSWHLGFLNPDEEYVGLEQSNGELDPEIAELYEGGTSAETIRAGGRRWDVYAAEGQDTALVHIGVDVTTVVVGTAEVAQLRELADALESRGRDRSVRRTTVQR